MFITKYIKDVYNGVKSLLVGMKRTLYYFTHHKEIITQQYPDNRDTLVLPERFKGEVVMPVSYTHLRAHETVLDLVCRLLLEKKKN